LEDIALIEIKGLFKTFGETKALSDLSFELSDGGIHAILGPAGAGKTTLLDILSGCKLADEGSVIINGVDISKEPIKAKKKIGYMPQIPPLYEDMTPYEYLVFVGDAKGVLGEKLYRNVESVIDLVGIGEASGAMIKKLSKSNRKKLAMAQAMLGNPDIILLDEPTAGLGAADAQNMRELIAKLGEIKTIVICSRKLTWLKGLCHDITIISGAEIIAQGSVEELEEKLRATTALRITARGDEEKIVSALEKVEGILECIVSSKENGVISLKIEHSSDTDIRDDVFNALAESGCPILAMDTESLTLDEVYLKICSIKENTGKEDRE